MLALSQAGWVAVGGMATAFIGGAFTLAGVAINALSQRKPDHLKPDDDPCAECKTELFMMTLDRDRWRNVAETFIEKTKPSET